MRSLVSMERSIASRGHARVQGASSQRFCGDAVKVGVCVWSPRITWIGRRQSARGFLWGEGVEISDHVVDQVYMGVRGECW